MMIHKGMFDLSGSKFTATITTNSFTPIEWSFQNGEGNLSLKLTATLQNEILSTMLGMSVQKLQAIRDLWKAEEELDRCKRVMENLKGKGI